MSHVLQFTVIWSADVVKFGARNVSFGMLVASLWHLGGPLSPSRRTSEHRKGDLGVHAWISVNLLMDFGTTF